ncbi:DUF916 domain-containing protein [Candidatus Parcubacteria bacterium]|nr:DUF916 domain-containing protein [Candidatus Parcubacteria bacterium]
MILTSKIQIKNSSWIFVLFIVIGVTLFPCAAVKGQEALSLTVSPTLYDMTANPGQEIQTMVRIINPNPYEITVYADVVNFAPQGEAGQGKFVPIMNEESKGQTIAEWIKVQSDQVTILAEKTMELPFTINVPENAAPGGHFAALLIGTKPPREEADVSQVTTAQIVTSLFFLRVTGEVIEQGDIRSFTTTETFLEKPEATFELRFENKGNVHILPQGEIKILNMWGQERGMIPINQSTMFGNVLPGSIRQYSFTWTGKWSLADIGRYQAIATLAYGQEGRQFATSETNFWVIPWKAVGGVLLLIVSFFLLITWAIKAYIRKMLVLAGLSPNMPTTTPTAVKRSKKVSMVAPIEEGILDLRTSLRDSRGWYENVSATISFAVRYRIFFMVVVAIILFIAALIWYVLSALVSGRQYEVVIEGLANDVTLSSEQVHYEDLRARTQVSSEISIRENFPPIEIVNQSGVPGLAAALRMTLEAEGYPVATLSNDLNRVEANTVIVYAPQYDKEALELSSKVYGALTSAYTDPSGTQAPIIIYVGRDLENAVQ